MSSVVKITHEQHAESCRAAALLADGLAVRAAPAYFSARHVIIGFPHTSNMDTLRAFTGFRIIKRTGHIMIKKEAFFWPLSILLHALGGIRSTATPLRAPWADGGRIPCTRRVFFWPSCPRDAQENTHDQKPGSGTSQEAPGSPSSAGTWTRNEDDPLAGRDCPRRGQDGGPDPDPGSLREGRIPVPAGNRLNDGDVGDKGD